MLLLVCKIKSLGELDVLIRGDSADIVGMKVHSLISFIIFISSIYSRNCFLALASSYNRSKSLGSLTLGDFVELVLLNLSL